MSARGRIALAALLVACAVEAVAAPVTSVFGGRVPCAAVGGVQFCGGTLATRVETWDGVPLDVSLTLPPAGMTAPFPLIIDLHGWSLFKAPGPFVDRALAGYAVLSFTARGFHVSCGSPASRLPDAGLANPNACVERGWVRLGDARYEARDAQHLAGLLADEGLVLPDRIGVTGISYGGGQSMVLAALRNRVMLPDGTLVPWKSPGGLDMAIAAAAPFVPWSDLAYALVPNGRTLDYRVDNPYGLRGGVQKQSWNALLYSVGLATGFYVPPGVDPQADLTAWNARIGAGEPYDEDPELRAILEEVTRHHSAYGIDDAVAPAPLFIYNAWTDDLFPVDETLRFWRRTRARHPGAEISLQFADDFGHPRSNLAGDLARVTARADRLFARHLKGEAAEPLPPVEVYTQGCNGSAVEGPFTAPDWDAVHPGEIRYVTRRTQRFDSRGGRPDHAAATDPLNGGPCRVVAAEDDPGAATYRLPPAKGTGYTLLGSPTVIAELAASSEAAQVAARLWDVAPDGTQALVTHALYRPRTDNAGPQVFQLHPSGWRFAAGHLPKLELLGQSAPYGRPSNGVFTVTVSGLELRLPVREAPDGRVVKAPAPAVEPPAESEPRGCALAPLAGCRHGAGVGRAELMIGTGPGSALDRLAFRFTPGVAAAPGDFGAPASSGYALCVYDGGARLVASALAPAATCAGRPCWTANGRGFRYLDRGARTGLRGVELRAGGAREAALAVVGRGPRLGPPALPLEVLPVTVQLASGDGACWEVTLDSVRRNTARRLKVGTGG